jgi:hypothetical protein
VVLGHAEQAPAHVALAREGVAQVVPTPRADLDLARDQLAGDPLGQ